MIWCPPSNTKIFFPFLRGDQEISSAEQVNAKGGRPPQFISFSKKKNTHWNTKLVYVRIMWALFFPLGVNIVSKKVLYVSTFERLTELMEHIYVYKYNGDAYIPYTPIHFLNKNISIFVLSQIILNLIYFTWKIVISFS